MKNYLDEAVESISESVRFDSSLTKHTSKMPFGKGAYDCLEHFLTLAQRLGFQTRNYDNYVGEVLFGNGTEEFAILCHLDIVPAGNGWTKDPFGGAVEDGKIWGRGTTDDKGPAICCLYALKALKDEGFVPSKTIKLIVGCNEESGWACIEHYREAAHMPEVGFSPDADFPVIYAEKGILQVRLHFPAEHPPFLFLEGGSAPNMVCDYCEATPRSLSARAARQSGLELAGKKLVSRGKGAHASTPEKGVNAILPILEYFRAKSEAANRAIECLFEDVYGLKKLRDETGRLTLSPNVIKFRKGQLLIIADIRYPATMKAEAVYEKLNRFGVLYETIHHQPPLFLDKEGGLVQTLLSVYRECTGKDAQPVAIGGGTYARALKCGAAFGPEMAGDPPVVHQADEFISIERVELLLKCYKTAIERLTK